MTTTTTTTSSTASSVYTAAATTPTTPTTTTTTHSNTITDDYPDFLGPSKEGYTSAYSDTDSTSSSSYGGFGGSSSSFGSSSSSSSSMPTTTKKRKPVFSQEHPPLFPLTQSTVWGFVLATLGLVVAAGGGIGGGGLLVPIYIIVMGFSPKHAIPLSNITVFGAFDSATGRRFVGWTDSP
jgi:hypothetical protein